MEEVEVVVEKGGGGGKMKRRRMEEGSWGERERKGRRQLESKEEE